MIGFVKFRAMRDEIAALSDLVLRHASPPPPAVRPAEERAELLRAQIEAAEGMPAGEGAPPPTEPRSAERLATAKGREGFQDWIDAMERDAARGSHNEDERPSMLLPVFQDERPTLADVEADLERERRDACTRAEGLLGPERPEPPTPPRASPTEPSAGMVPSQTPPPDSPRQSPPPR